MGAFLPAIRTGAVVDLPATPKLHELVFFVVGDVSLPTTQQVG